MSGGGESHVEDTKVRELWEAQVSRGGESHVEDTKVRELWEAQVSGEDRAMWRTPR